MTDSLPTPEIVEWAARGMHDHWKGVFPNSWGDWDDLPEYDKDCTRQSARAALTAVIPSLIEAAAKVADDMAARCPGIVGSIEAATLADGIATAIRSLIPSKENEHG